MKSLGLPIAALVLAGGACGNVDLGPVPADINACRPDPMFFYERVWPELLSKEYGGKSCGAANCHDQTSGRQLLVIAPTSQATLPLPEDWASLYRSVTAQMLCTNVEQSPLLLRPDGRQAHGGGKLFEPGGAETTLLRQWVEAGK